jgi:hypothetical protein
MPAPEADAPDAKTAKQQGEDATKPEPSADESKEKGAG